MEEMRLRTVTENTASLNTRFNMAGIDAYDKEGDYHRQRSCFYEFGIDNNEFLEKLRDNQDDSIVDDINQFFV